MPNNKKHNVSDIKDLDKAHPYSRKATQARRALNRQATIGKKAAERNTERSRLVDRTVWFKYALAEDITCATMAQVHDIILSYISRNDDEIEKLKSNLRKGRPRPARLELLETLRGKDLQEYATGGIELPDLTDAKNLSLFRAWEGDYNALDKIKFVRVRDPLKAAEDNKLRKEEAEKRKEKKAAEKKAMAVNGDGSKKNGGGMEVDARAIAEATGMDVDA
ncbi:hypothetical protein HK104_002552 [Borealophlyctis nickersoniae]|nr:hypothetical protein HK104_002552 [Borealophlyctis nickersoniae]